MPCIYAEKRREGNDLKTFCHATVGEPYPVSDDFTKEWSTERECGGKGTWGCRAYRIKRISDVVSKTLELTDITLGGRLIFSVVLGLVVYTFGLRFAIPEEANGLVLNLICLIGSIASIFTFIETRLLWIMKRSK